MASTGCTNTRYNWPEMAADSSSALLSVKLETEADVLLRNAVTSFSISAAGGSAADSTRSHETAHTKERCAPSEYSTSVTPGLSTSFCTCASVSGLGY